MWAFLFFLAVLSSFAGAVSELNSSIWSEESVRLSTITKESRISSATSFPSSFTYGFVNQILGPIHDQQHKRDDVVFAESESMQEEIERIYAKQDSSALDISPEDRLLRVAAAYRYSGDDVGNWAKKWATEYKWALGRGKTLSEAFAQFAYDARFGPAPPLYIKSRIENFDFDYRRLHALPSKDYEALTVVGTVGPRFEQLKSQYLNYILITNRMKQGTEWVSYLETSYLPSTTFCTPRGDNNCNY